MSAENKTIKKIPYGITDYELIRAENYYYVDKTPYLKTFTQAGRYLFFIRPRRFGKSLFISLMESYFDILYKDRFKEFFKGTWIYEHPTEEKNNFLVLSFNFSGVEPDPGKMEASFLNHVKGKAVDFILKYSDYLSTDRNYFAKAIEENRSAPDILSNLFLLCKGAQQKLYVLIDEYDNFSNTILSTAGEGAYQNLTHGAGFFRSFFNVLKEGTTGTGAPVTRSFITGVSPITMDDVTSGYNIGENVSLDAAFNQVPGFTGAEVNQLLNYYQSTGRIKHEPGYLMEIINQWYGNYLFSPYANTGERLYNPDMMLYFLKEYFKTQSIPDDLIDRNVRVDYGKLRHLIMVDKDKTKPPSPNGNFSKLKEIIDNEGTSAKIAKGFPLEELTDTDNFVSLLFYFGLLTIENPEKDKIQLEIPNETMKRLYYDYIKKGYRETEVFDLDLTRYSNLMSDMAYDGEWKPLFDYIAGRMRESMSLRELITGEKSIQAFLNVYLGLSNLYIIHPEREMNKGFADIVLEPFLARYEGIKYSYLLEIKYIKAGGKSKLPDAKIQRLKSEAEAQLKQYSLDKKFRKNIKKTTLIQLVLIFSGHELVYIDKLD